MTEDRYSYLLTLIPKGKNNAIKREYLINPMGVKTTREVSAIVASARNAGIIIASCSNGYYIPQNRAELEAFYHWMRGKSLSALKTLKATRKRLQDGEKKEV